MRVLLGFLINLVWERYHIGLVAIQVTLSGLVEGIYNATH
jgi:hypothetical protein